MRRPRIPISHRNPLRTITDEKQQPERPKSKPLTNRDRVPKRPRSSR